jgi:LmbE family N-acetylglucosaminyl deacetylase
MKNRFRLLAVILAAFVSIPSPACAMGSFKPNFEVPAPPEAPSIKPVSRSDRLLIIAPHPDDEALGVGGLLQKALAAGASVRLVYLTCGDYNELAFILFRKRLGLSPVVNREMGKMRQAEAQEAMAHLGLSSEDLVFLGYPDSGLMDIWNSHWGAMEPFRSRSTRTTEVSYEQAASYGRPHKGESIAADLQKQVEEFRPTRIFVTGPFDSHPDHTAAWLFTWTAVLQSKANPKLEILVYPIHVQNWPFPYGLHVERWLPVPMRLRGDQAKWFSLPLSADEVRLKRTSLDFYKTQQTEGERWMASFVRRNELFADYAMASLKRGQWASDQQLLSGTDKEALSLPQDAENKPVRPISKISYQVGSDGLVVQIVPEQLIDLEIGLYVRIAGFRADQPFETMPKIELRWLMGNAIRLENQGVDFEDPSVTVQFSGARRAILIPWKVIGDPEYLFVQTEGQIGWMTTSRAAWQLIRREEMERVSAVFTKEAAAE